MSQSEKAAYFQALKKSGVDFPKHYREYTTEELKDAYERLVEADPTAVRIPAEQPADAQQPLFEMTPADVGEPEDPELDAAASSFFGLQKPAPTAKRDPAELAGQRQNSKAEDEPIRVDPETGRVWYQEEIAKPAYPKPRGRRVLTYADPGTKTQTIQRGDYIESFEVAGDEVGRTAEVKITLPAYQVGIYKDPRFPFKVHTYNGIEGFDLFDVRDYYGGGELVPPEVKRIYVANVLCYDIRTTVRAINDEYRQLQLQGKA